MPAPRRRTQRETLERRLSRRRFLQHASLLAAGLAAANCSDDPVSEPSPSVVAEPTPAPFLVEAVPGYDDPSRWEGQTLSVTSWGGDYQEAQEQAFFEPFERLTGATISIDPTDVEALRAQVDTGQVTWDICDIFNEDVLPLANLGVIQSIDYSVIDTAELFPEAVREHALASGFYSTVLAYRADVWEDQPPPSGWSDFWNLEQYPGSRGLHRDPQTTLEFALLADGVSQVDLYPLNVERAIASLDRIRPSLLLWWEQGAQPTQMVTSGDIDMVSVWNSRIEEISSADAPVLIQWSGGAITGDSWVLPSGAPHTEMALDFMNFATRPETCAAFSSLVPFGPVNRRTFELLPEELLATLPTSPGLKPLQFNIDHEWWFAYREAVVVRFEEWLAEVP